ncbi:MAG: lipoxygenase family protein, partial [Leptospirales bacterium]
PGARDSQGPGAREHHRLLRLDLKLIGSRAKRHRDRSIAAFEPWIDRILRPGLDRPRKPRKKRASKTGVADPSRSIAEYRDQFQSWPLPVSAKYLHDDLYFAWQRLAGQNPTLLRRARKAKAGVRLGAKEFRAQAAFAEDSLSAAAREGRLYELDFDMLAGMPAGDYPRGPKYLYAPYALFAVARSDRRLYPVAIQCEAKGAVFTPADAWAWRMAKTIVEVADGNYHEAVLHLGRTHLVTEAFVLATRRQLDDSHPLSLLLRPHFEGTLYINDRAQSKLIAPGGGVEQLLAGTLDATRGLTGRDLLERFEFNKEFLPESLRARGVDDPDLLPDFPYRDDALPIWSAIAAWVSAYLGLYYHSDVDVLGDAELQRWASELVSPAGGVLRGFGESTQGRRASPRKKIKKRESISTTEARRSIPLIQTRSYLEKALTQVIFTASAQHAVVNFPQNAIMSYTPTVPLALYAPAPVARAKKSADAKPRPAAAKRNSQGVGFEDYSEADWLAMLPPGDMALEQMELTATLGSVHYTRLGKYPAGHFRDTRVAVALSEYQRNLKNIESRIKARNARRPEPYLFLLPSKIPQSVNI